MHPFPKASDSMQLPFFDKLQRPPPPAQGRALSVCFSSFCDPLTEGGKPRPVCGKQLQIPAPSLRETDDNRRRAAAKASVRGARYGFVGEEKGEGRFICHARDHHSVEQLEILDALLRSLGKEARRLYEEVTELL